MTTAYTTLVAKVEALATELPGITFGYIGNVERWGDDRTWYVFLPHPGRVGDREDAVGLGTNFDAALRRWAEIEKTARRLYHNGSRRG
jgi:hypothetical protein